LLRKTCRSSRHSCNGVPGLRDQGLEINVRRTQILNKDPLGRDGNGFRGRNPTVEVAVMYTGQLISDLMAIVEQAGQKAQRRQTEAQEELHAIFAMQIPVTPNDQIFMGAA
jgi:hypothetical protein